MITKIIDYRNLKYQGQTLNGHPHGIGIIYDYKNLFALAQWTNGEINGPCLIVFGDSKIFYGSIKNRVPDGICTYHLKDKCQVFCNFHQQSPNTNLKNQPQQEPTKNILVALLPSFNMIIKVVGQREEQLLISDEQVYKKNDIASIGRILQKMLGYRFMQNELDAYLTLEGFVRKMFMQKKEYQGLLDTVYLTTPEGAKELFLTFKTTFNQHSLGIKIQNCMDDPNAMTNIHNDGHSYIVKAVGMFSKEGLLQYGLKNVKTLIKGSVKQESINNDEKSVIRYENQAARPKKCSVQMLNHLKSSPNFINKYMATKHLYTLQTECLSINFNIKETQTKKFAQLILENPKEFTHEERETIERVRGKKNKDGSEQKNVNETPQKKSAYNKVNEKYQKQSDQLQLTKQDIYRSVSKKKHHEKSSSPYARTNLLNNSPQKQIKPSQLTTIKPILQLYKNTADDSFYNSINKSPQGYKFPIGREYDMRDIPIVEMRTPDGKHGNSMSADYIKGLENRRRLYEESDLNRVPVSVVEEGYGNGNNNGNRKKYHYLPDSSFQLSSRPVTHIAASDQKHTPFSRYGDDYHPSTHTLTSYNIDHYTPNGDYLLGRKKNDRSLSKQGRDDSQVGKLRRVRPMQTQNNNARSQKILDQYKPIIVPQFKISNTKIGSQDYLQNYPKITTTRSPNQNRQPFLKVLPVQQRSSRRSPLKPSQDYRRGDVSYNGIDEPQNRYTNEVMDRARERSRSPQQTVKRRRMLTDNPFNMM